MNQHDDTYMAMALEQARIALAAGEVPVGAVVVRDGQVIGRGSNAPIAGHDPCAHAEIQALRNAAQSVSNYRLEDCEMFVTLEPCVMCSGAVLHARLKRLVFGAPDPKTGAAGSVLNLFANRQLNHHTEVASGALAPECSALLKIFFKTRRAASRSIRSPIRDDVLRTPDSQFHQLRDYPWPPCYVNDLPSLQGLRLHYLDLGSRQAALTYLCLHGNKGWSYTYRKMLPTFEAGGNRVVAPDLIGFGKSDKPKRENFHTLGRHRKVLLELIERLDLRNIVLVLHDVGSILGLTLALADARRFHGVLHMTTQLAQDAAEPDAAARLALAAPFPNQGYCAALRAFAKLTARPDKAEELPISDLMRLFWREGCTAQTTMAIDSFEALAVSPIMLELRELIRGIPAPMLLEQAGDFAPDHGQAMAEEAVHYFASNPSANFA